MGTAENSSSSSSSCGTSEKAQVAAPMDLFDDYWFFSNTLNSKSAKNLSRCSSLPANGNTNSLDATWNSIKAQRKVQEPEGLVSMRKLLSTSTFDARLLRSSQQKKGADRILHQALLRMTSMPSPRNPQDELDVQSSKKNRGCKENIEKKSLRDQRTAITLLTRAPSLPAPEISKAEMAQDVGYHPNLRIAKTDTKSGRATPSTGKARPPRDLKAFQARKWKSYSDLEAMEIQALRDLGFALDHEVSNSERKAKNDDNEVDRPCLSEAWFGQKSAPAMPKWVSKSSAVDMKEQIKFWARNVACNVREKC